MPRLGRFGVLTLLLLLLVPGRTNADPDLTALVAAAYFPRTEDATLHQIAHERAVEISTDWSHNGQRSGTAEVLAYNSGFADPVSKAVEQWMGSPTHHAILSDPTWTHIGCGSYTDGTTTWFACVLAAPTIQAPPPNPPPAPPAETPIRTPAPVVLPDTRMP